MINKYDAVRLIESMNVPRAKVYYQDPRTTHHSIEVMYNVSEIVADYGVREFAAAFRQHANVEVGKYKFQGKFNVRVQVYH